MRVERRGSGFSCGQVLAQAPDFIDLPFEQSSYPSHTFSISLVYSPSPSCLGSLGFNSWLWSHGREGRTQVCLCVPARCKGRECWGLAGQRVDSCCWRQQRAAWNSRVLRIRGTSKSKDKPREAEWQRAHSGDVWTNAEHMGRATSTADGHLLRRTRAWLCPGPACRSWGSAVPSPR